jgi:hypothetical protein
MDMDAFAKGVRLFGSALATLQQVIALPDGSKKAEASAALERAEREFKTAEAEVADKLEYEICRSHFPPETMLSKDERNWQCPKCGNTMNRFEGMGVV